MVENVGVWGILSSRRSRARRVERLRALDGQLVTLGVLAGGRIRAIHDVLVRVGTVEAHPAGDRLSVRVLDFPEPGRRRPEVFDRWQSGGIPLTDISRIETVDGDVDRF